MNVVTERLLTPVGLRSLSRDHPDYKPTYSGDLRSRDAAYHQGTVWAWLIGPYIDAWLKLHPQDKAAARRFVLRVCNGIGGCRHRLHQRDLRRRGTAYPERLHRTGVERGRSSKMLGQNRRAGRS